MMFGRNKRTPEQKTNYNTIAGALVSAISLLEAREYESGLNVAVARRTLPWAWSTYSYLHDGLAEKDRKQLTKLLVILEVRVQDFDWDQNNTTDGWDEAMERC